MALGNKEKTAILVSHLISIYSDKLRENIIPQNQSVIDFVLKNIPETYKQELTMDLIDDVIAFISSKPMELS